MIDLTDWDYDDYFASRGRVEQHPVIAEVEAYVTARDLASHPFFELAANSRRTLEVWVSQELVMTNTFSQIVLAAASQIRNVHIRAILCEVAYGEHLKARDGCASHSHPWLLGMLRESVSLAADSIKPLPATLRFIRDLYATVSDPIRSVAAIGVGNERLIAPEYAAIERCFRTALPQANFEPFLHANVNEDLVHSRLCYEAASALIHQGASAEVYRDAAVASVESRWRYFDDLAEYCRP